MTNAHFSATKRIESRLSRREVLSGAAAIPVALLCQPHRSSTGSEEGTPQDVDCHSHIWTPDIRSYPLKKGTTKKDLQPPSFTTEQLLEVARRNHVGRVVLIQHHKFYGFDNSYMIDAARKHPGTFAIVGMVDDRSADPAREMLELKKHAVTGFRITSWIHGKERWLDGAGMAAMWKQAAESRQNMCCLIDPDDLPAVKRMCAKFPETPVVIDHFARIGVDGKIRESDVKQLCSLAAFKNTKVKVSAFYALGSRKPPYADLVPMVRRVFQAYGPQRLMWGSDSPYQIDGANSYESSLRLVREELKFLSSDDRQWLLRKTAESVFFS